MLPGYTVSFSAVGNFFLLCLRPCFGMGRAATSELHCLVLGCNSQSGIFHLHFFTPVPRHGTCRHRCCTYAWICAFVLGFDPQGGLFTSLINARASARDVPLPANCLLGGWVQLPRRLFSLHYKHDSREKQSVVKLGLYGFFRFFHAIKERAQWGKDYKMKLVALVGSAYPILKTDDETLLIDRKTESDYCRITVECDHIFSFGVAKDSDVGLSYFRNNHEYSLTISNNNYIAVSVSEDA